MKWNPLHLVETIARAFVIVLIILLLAAILMIVIAHKIDADQEILHHDGGGGIEPCAGMVDPDGLLDFGSHVAFVVARWPRYDEAGHFVDCYGAADWLQTRCDYVEAVFDCLWRGENMGIEFACCPIMIPWDEIDAPIPPPPPWSPPPIATRHDPPRIFDDLHAAGRDTTWVTIAGRRIDRPRTSGIYFRLVGRTRPEKVMIVR